MTWPGLEGLLINRGDSVSSMLVSVRRRQWGLGESFPAFCVFSRSWCEAHPLPLPRSACWVFSTRLGSERVGLARLGLPSLPPQALASCTSPCRPAGGWAGTSVLSCPAGRSQADPASQGPMSHLRGGWEMLLQQVALCLQFSQPQTALHPWPHNLFEFHFLGRAGSRPHPVPTPACSTNFLPLCSARSPCLAVLPRPWHRSWCGSPTWLSFSSPVTLPSSDHLVGSPPEKGLAFLHAQGSMAPSQTLFKEGWSPSGPAHRGQ